MVYYKHLLQVFSDLLFSKSVTGFQNADFCAPYYLDKVIYMQVFLFSVHQMLIVAKFELDENCLKV